jgi:hypothetical protein
MAGAEFAISTHAPKPPEADFAFFIDFVRGQGPAARVFVAAQEFIRACERLDKTLCEMIDSRIEPIVVLEELESGSLKIWLRDVLRSTDDEGLKTLDWKAVVGKFLVRAKYFALNWLDEEQGPTKCLPDLARRLQVLASETDVKHLPDYAAPRAQDLVEAMSKFQSAKDALAPGDKAKFISDAGNVEFNLAIRWGQEELTALAVGQTISSPPAVMILAVKRPDYLGESQWDFRHGKSAIKGSRLALKFPEQKS